MIRDDWMLAREVASGAVAGAGRVGAFRWLAQLAVTRGWRDVQFLALLAAGIAIA